MALSSDHELAPADIEQADFPTAFRGYEQEAVRRYLARLAHTLERQNKFAALGDIDLTVATQDRVEELEKQLASSRAEIEQLEASLAEERGEVEQLRGELDGRRSTKDPTPLTDLDESRIIEVLGQETARVLESARAAAADIVKRSETKGADIEREAQDLLIKARRDARSAVAEKKVEADKLVSKVVGEAETRARNLTAEAKKHREMVMEESSRILSDAETKAETQETEARERAAQIVADAESLRRQVLSELVIERSRMRAELDGVASTKDRLVMTLSLARGELDSMMDELANADVLPAGQDVTEAEAEQEVDALITELESKRVASKARQRSATEPKRPPAPASTNGTGTDHPELRRAAPDATIPEVDADQAQDDAGTEAESEVDAGQGREVEGPEADLVLHIDDHDGVDTLEFEDGSSPSGGPDPVGGPDAVGGSDPVGGSDDDGSSAGAVAEIERNGLIEGFHTIELDDEDDADPADGDPDAYEDHVMTTVAARTTPAGAARARGDLLLEEPFTGRLPAHFKARDVALTRYGPNFRRHLRRALNDDQSDVLDRLRTGKGAIKVDELPPREEQTARYLQPLSDGLMELAQAGLKAGGGRRLASGAVDKLVMQLASYIVEKVRVPTVEAVESATDTDREKVLEPIRAQYRDFRNTSLTDLADDALYEAFAIGLFQSIGDGADVAWVVDPRSDPDPICEINSDRGGLTKGEEFPSGHARPLALSNCRCLVIADR